MITILLYKKNIKRDMVNNNLDNINPTTCCAQNNTLRAQGQGGMIPTTDEHGFARKKRDINSPCSQARRDLNYPN